MKAHEILKESSDTRSTKEKLIDLINHPDTLEHIKNIAQNKLDSLYSNPNIICNIREDDLNSSYVNGITYRDIMISLEKIPKLAQIRFGHGVIGLLITPPFETPVSKDKLISHIRQKLPWLRRGKITYTLQGNYEMYFYF